VEAGKEGGLAADAATGSAVHIHNVHNNLVYTVKSFGPFWGLCSLTTTRNSTSGPIWHCSPLVHFSYCLLSLVFPKTHPSNCGCDIGRWIVEM